MGGRDLLYAVGRGVGPGILGEYPLDHDDDPGDGAAAVGTGTETFEPQVVRGAVERSAFQPRPARRADAAEVLPFGRIRDGGTRASLFVPLGDDHRFPADPAFDSGLLETDQT